MILSRFLTSYIGPQSTMPSQPVIVESARSVAIFTGNGRFNNADPPARSMPFLIHPYTHCPSYVKVLSRLTSWLHRETSTGFSEEHRLYPDVTSV
jgi:hypothetical protein